VIKRLGNNHYTRPPVDKHKDEQDHWTSLVGKYLAIATQNISMIGAGVLFGWYLDKALDSSPVFLITCTFCGAIGGFYHLVSFVSNNHKKTDD
jgi:F0F1-type ATP synthase assembly protein I